MVFVAVVQYHHGITFPVERSLFGVCATPLRSSATRLWPNTTVLCCFISA